MKELKEFISGLKRMEFEVVSIGEVFSDEDSRLINLNELLFEISKLGIKEILDIYHESIELVTSEGKYIEVVGVY